MLNRLLVVLVALLCAAFTFPVNSLAQTSSSSAKDWPDTNPTRTTTQNGERAVPVRDISGMWSGLWGAREGNQAKGVHLHPNGWNAGQSAALHSPWLAGFPVPQASGGLR